MKLFSFLVKQSPGVLTLAVATGIASGVASAGLMAVINHTVARPGHPSSMIAWSFVGITAAVLLAHLSSRLLLLRLSTRAVLKMRMHLCEQVLASPLRTIESHGSARRSEEH